MAIVFWQGRNEKDNTVALKTFEIYEVKPSGREFFLQRVSLIMGEVRTILPDNINYRCYEPEKGMLLSGKISTGEYRFEVVFPK